MRIFGEDRRDRAESACLVGLADLDDDRVRTVDAGGVREIQLSVTKAMVSGRVKGKKRRTSRKIQCVKQK